MLSVNYTNVNQQPTFSSSKITQKQNLINKQNDAPCYLDGIPNLKLPNISYNMNEDIYESDYNEEDELPSGYSAISSAFRDNELFDEENDVVTFDYKRYDDDDIPVARKTINQPEIDIYA